MLVFLIIDLMLLSCVCGVENEHQIPYSPNASDFLVVDAPDNGLIKGIKVVSKMGLTVTAFLGIPFAKPPVGLRRFDKPEYIERENGTLDATKARPGCLQLDFKYSELVDVDNGDTTEDCLYVNVYVPTKMDSSDEEDRGNLSRKSLPVFVFLYGGVYTWGENRLALYDGVEFAAEAEAIFVVPNYRLNIFGFLKTFKQDVPDNIQGNMGLWDQYLALKWVNANIKAFGGNPNEVTLGGQSAGAFSAGILSTSNLSKGLFKRTWLMSGSPLSLKSFYSPAEDLAAKVESFFNSCADSEHPAAELQCIRKSGITRKELMLIAEELTVKWMTFNPRSGDELFPYPTDELHRNKYHIQDMVIGVTEREGDFFVSAIERLTPVFKDLLVQSPQSTLRIILRLMFGMRSSESSKLYDAYAAEIENFNTANETEVLRMTSSIVGDALFNCPVSLFASHAAQNGVNVRHYVYAHEPSVLYNLNLGSKPTHIDDIPFQLGSINAVKENSVQLGMKLPDFFVTLQQKFSPEEHHFSRMIVKQISNFLHSRKLTIPGSNQEWPFYSAVDPQILYLAPNNFSVSKGPKSDKCAMWEPFLVSINPVALEPTLEDVGTDKPQNQISHGKLLRLMNEEYRSASIPIHTHPRLIFASIAMLLLSLF